MVCTVHHGLGSFIWSGIIRSRYRFQKYGVRMPITVKTSRRPASMRKQSTPLEKTLASPTEKAYFPIAGPELLIAEHAILILEMKSF